MRHFKYVRNIVVNHTDDTLLPYDVCDRRDLNLVSLDREDDLARQLEGEYGRDDVCVAPTYTMATHIITPARPGGHKAVYQTTNPIIPPRPSTILSTATIERVVLTVESKRARRDLMTETTSFFGRRQSALGPLQGAGRVDRGGVPGIWLCGSYAHAGIPLLEACVASARNVVENGIYKVEGVRPVAAIGPR